MMQQPKNQNYIWSDLLTNQRGGGGVGNLLYSSSQSYLPPTTYRPSKDNNNSSLKPFSYLPFLPKTMSQFSRGLIGLAVFLLFIAITGIILGLIPSFIYGFGPETVVKESFSIDVKDGLKLKDQTLSSILQVDESARSLEQNLTVLNEMTALMNELNEKLKSRLDANIEQIYNIRMIANTTDNSIDVSYSLKTKPMTRATSVSLKEKINKLVMDNSNFEDIFLGANTTIVANTNRLLSDPVNGEFTVKNSLLSSSLVSPTIEKMKNHLLLEGDLVPEFNPGLLKGPPPPRHKDHKIDEELLKESSRIKRLKDSHLYRYKSEPIYYSNPRPVYTEQEYENERQYGRPFQSNYQDNKNDINEQEYNNRNYENHETGGAYSTTTAAPSTLPTTYTTTTTTTKRIKKRRKYNRHRNEKKKHHLQKLMKQLNNMDLSSNIKELTVTSTTKTKDEVVSSQQVVPSVLLMLNKTPVETSTLTMRNSTIATTLSMPKPNKAKRDQMIKSPELNKLTSDLSGLIKLISKLKLTKGSDKEGLDDLDGEKSP